MFTRQHSFAVALASSLALHLLCILAILYQRPDFLRKLAPENFWTSDFGEHGAGDSLNFSPGDEPLRAHRADEVQVQLSRDPIGPGVIGDPPSPSVVPFAAESLPTAPQLPALANAFGPPGAATDLIPPRMKSSSSLRPADPAPDRGTETDAFSKVGSVAFHAGKAEASLGRAAKLVRPRFSVAALVDLFALNNPKAVLKVNIDEAGHVTNVEFLKSTGANSIDQPIKVATYESTFEPTHNSAGKAVKDVLVYTIAYID